MKIALFTNSISPHQLPLMRELAAMHGVSSVLYAYERAGDVGRAKLGWKQVPEAWCCEGSDCRDNLESCDLLLVGGLRPVALMERRVAAGKTTWYMSERWFKPPIGMLRLLHPRYFAVAKRFVQLMRGKNAFKYLPIGIHAASDMARLCGLFAGDLRCLFHAPELEFDKTPGGRIFSRVERVDRAEKKYCLHKMRMWGYFVASGERGTGNGERRKDGSLRVLWVGRLLKWKCVDTIIRAVGELSAHSTCSLAAVSSAVALAEEEALAKEAGRPKITLDIYGAGPEEFRMKKMAAKYGDAIKFHPPVPIDEVRKLMREHDVYVLSSNGYEGWGAVVSEALEEGMKVIGTYEAGSSVTILPKEMLFHAGNVNMLICLLQNIMDKNMGNVGIGKWSSKEAAKAIMNLMRWGAHNGE